MLKNYIETGEAAATISPNGMAVYWAAVENSEGDVVTSLGLSTVVADLHVQYCKEIVGKCLRKAMS